MSVNRFLWSGAGWRILRASRLAFGYFRRTCNSRKSGDI